MCIARWMTVYGAFAYMTSRIEWMTSSPPTPRIAAPRIAFDFDLKARVRYCASSDFVRVTLPGRVLSPRSFNPNLHPDPTFWGVGFGRATFRLFRANHR